MKTLTDTDARVEAFGRELLQRAEAEHRDILLEPELYGLMAAAGIDVPRHRFIAGPEEVDEALFGSDRIHGGRREGGLPDILHKSDVGGVLVCPNNPGAVREAVAAVLASAGGAAPNARVWRGPWSRRRSPSAADPAGRSSPGSATTAPTARSSSSASGGSMPSTSCAYSARRARA